MQLSRQQKLYLSVARDTYISAAESGAIPGTACSECAELRADWKTACCPFHGTDLCAIQVYEENKHEARNALYSHFEGCSARIACRNYVIFRDFKAVRTEWLILLSQIVFDIIHGRR